MPTTASRQDSPSSSESSESAPRARASSTESRSASRSRSSAESDADAVTSLLSRLLSDRRLRLEPTGVALFEWRPRPEASAAYVCRGDEGDAGESGRPNRSRATGVAFSLPSPRV